MRSTTKISLYVIGCGLAGLVSAYVRDEWGIQQWIAVLGIVVFDAILWIALFVMPDSKNKQSNIPT